jgi:hypothetical protein
MKYDYQEFQNYFHLFEMEGHCPEWPLFKSPESTELLRNRAASYGGLIAISSFIRAFSELKSEAKIRQIRNPLPPEPLEPELTVEMFRSMPAQAIIKKYRSDPDFKIGVDSLIERGLI